MAITIHLKASILQAALLSSQNDVITPRGCLALVYGAQHSAIAVIAISEQMTPEHQILTTQRADLWAESALETESVACPDSCQSAW